MIPAIVGAALCLFLIRSGFGVLFFLLPLGFIGYGWGPKTLWPGVLFAVIGNSILTLFVGLSFRIPGGDMVWDILYIAATATAFAWIILPFDENSARIPGALRLALGSLVCTFVFIGLFIKSLNTPHFYEAIKNQVDVIASFYRLGNTAEVQNSTIGGFDIDAIIETARNLILRGGAFFSSAVMLFINRQLSKFLIRLFGVPREKNVFLGFHVHPQMLWVFLFSVLLILVSNMLKWTVLEIVFANKIFLIN